MRPDEFSGRLAAGDSEPDRRQAVKADAIAPPLRGFGLDGLTPSRFGLPVQLRVRFGSAVVPPIANSEAAERTSVIRFLLTTKLRFISCLVVFLDAGQVAVIFEREPSRQAPINRGCRRINVAQFLADLYAITRQSIRTDRLPFCLHQYLWFMLFEILGSAELISPGTGYSDAKADSAPAITCPPTHQSRGCCRLYLRVTQHV